jgi:hypothetical protein
LLIGTACDVLGGVARASAEAFHAVDSQVSGPKPNLVAGLLRGNARFLKEMSHTMETVAERFRSGHVTGTDQSSTSTVRQDPVA